MSFSIIVALSQNFVIGNKNTMPWSIPEDMKIFRKYTLGHTVVMGRKTYQSMSKALPQRENIVLSRNKHLQKEINDATVYHNIGEIPDNNEVFIIGGSEIYKIFLPIAQKIYLTSLKKDFQGDTFFPDFNIENYNIVFTKEHISEKNNLEFSFQILEKLN